MILHLDMDAFFASIEQRDDPRLRGRPVIVGGGVRGVVSTASYEARRFGVHSAMPMAVARRLCPDGVFVTGRHERYAHTSHAVMAELEKISPCVEQASIDEAYINAAGLEHLFGTTEQLISTIKMRIHAATGGLTCSIGAAPVKFLAKICSDINKPDGSYILQPERIPEFLSTLPVEKLPGVGAKMRRTLGELGIETVRHLARYSREFLTGRFGKAGGILFDRAHGLDTRLVLARQPAKSESSECTLQEDTTDPRILFRHMLSHAEDIGASLRKRALAGRTVTLKIKFADFRQITRSKTLPLPTNCTETIFSAAKLLLAGVDLGMPVRLIGLSVSGFAGCKSQLELPGILLSQLDGQKTGLPGADTESRLQNLDAAIDTIRARFGKNAVIRGRLFAGVKTQSHP